MPMQLQEIGGRTIMNIRALAFASLALAVSLSSAAPALAKNKEPLVLAPSSGWQVKFGDRSCAVSQQFGEGENVSLLGLKGTDPLGAVDLTVIGKPFEMSPFDNPLSIEYALTPTGVTGSFKGSAVSAGGYKGFMTTATFGGEAIEKPKAKPRPVPGPGSQGGDEAKTPEEKPARVSWSENLKPVSSITLSGDFKAGKVVLQTANMGDMMLAVQQCQDAQLVKWGLDPAVQRTLSKGIAMKNGATFATIVQRDYPDEAFHQDQQAWLGLLFLVDEKGEMTSCEVERITEAEKFGARLCSIARNHLKFEPAEDKSGKPVSSYLIILVRYLL